MLYWISKLLVTSVVSLFYLSLPHPAIASILVTEVHPNPLSGLEWVELYNDSDTSIALNSWWLEDWLSSPSIIFMFSNQILSPYSYLKVDLPTQKLNNTTDGVTLKNSEGFVMDSMSYPETTPGHSYSRLPSSNTFIESDPTPGLPNTVTQPSPTPTFNPSPTPSPYPPTTELTAFQYLQPSEIMACPVTGEQEWLEVYNPTDSLLYLQEWRIKDAANNLRIVSATIEPHAFGSFSWASGLLNNTGDTLSLLSADNDLLFSAEFGPCQKNTSFIFSNETWAPTTSVTRDSLNRLSSPPSPSPTASTISPVVTPTSTSNSSILNPSATPTTAPQSAQNTLTNPSFTPLLSNLLATQSATTSVQLSANVSHPFIDNAGNITNLQQPLPNVTAILSVIMGGTVLVAIHGLKLFRLYQYATAHPASQPVTRLFS